MDPLFVVVLMVVMLGAWLLVRARQQDRSQAKRSAYDSKAHVQQVERDMRNHDGTNGF